MGSRFPTLWADCTWHFPRRLIGCRKVLKEKKKKIATERIIKVLMAVFTRREGIAAVGARWLVLLRKYSAVTSRYTGKVGDISRRACLLRNIYKVGAKKLLNFSYLSRRLCTKRKTEYAIIS